jgi:hypothetical protein
VNFIEFKLQFADSASLRLMRAENAALVLAVLFSAFKRDHLATISESRLRAILEAELEEQRDAGEVVADKKAKDYLSEWSDQSHRYLRRHQPDGENEPVFELTSELEQVFQWFDTLKPRTHVGTESKFKSLVTVLEDIVINSTTEPNVRIQYLEEEQARLQREIEDIRRTGTVTTYTATQVNERFASVLETARRLLGDFREVERHFRRVTENISVQQSSSDATRGCIVGQTLDAQEQLRQSSQGQSFYAFWDFLLAPERRRHFTDLVGQAYSIPLLADELKSEALLRRLQANLRAEGNKVVASNERLVAQLRRVLDIRETAERRAIGRLIQEIKGVAHQTREMSPQAELLELDAEIPLASLMSKAFWAPPEYVTFGDGLEISEAGDFLDALDAYLQMHPVDFERLRQNIQECLQTRVQITLPELLELRPPRNGILEVLAYLFIAESDGPHAVLDSFDLVDLPGDLRRRYQVPQVVFSNT